VRDNKGERVVRTTAPDGTVSITRYGESVAEGTKDYATINGNLDKYKSGKMPNDGIQNK
jgi:hypothetical protein